MAESDILTLTKIFGTENVFDFSGINEYTQDYVNFYDINHYRSDIAKDIVRVLYLN